MAMFQGNIAENWILLDITRYYQILPDITGYYQILPDITGYYQILPDITRYYQIFPDITRYYQIFPDITRYYQISNIAQNNVGVSVVHSPFRKSPFRKVAFQKVSDIFQNPNLSFRNGNSMSEWRLSEW